MYNNLGMSHSILSRFLEVKTSDALAQHPMVTLLEIDKFEQLSDKYNVPIIFDSLKLQVNFMEEKNVSSLWNLFPSS